MSTICLLNDIFVLCICSRNKKNIIYLHERQKNNRNTFYARHRIVSYIKLKLKFQF